MGFLRRLRKTWATRDYARKLPKLLARDYGFSASYTPVQVRRTIERYDLNRDYACYAISMFSDRTAFDQYHHGLGEPCDYDAMRAEVAATHFHGNVNFSLSDMLKGFSDGADSFASGADHGAGGGHSQGHGDGGYGHKHAG